MVEQLSLFGDENTLYNTGLQHLLEMDFGRCVETLKRYARLFPWGRDPVKEIAIGRFWQEKLEMARWTAIVPHEAERRYNLWLQFEQLFGYPRSRESIERQFQIRFFSRLAEGLEKGKEGERTTLPQGTPVGFLYLLAGRPDPAIALLQALIAAEPDHGKAYGYLGDAYALRGDLRTARICYREAFAMAPDQVDIVHLQDSELKEWLEALEREEGVEDDPLGWFPVVAQLEGFFEWRDIRNLEELKAWIERYLDLVEVFEKKGDKALIPRLFYHAMVLSDNAAILRFIKKVDVIEVRKRMKAWDSDLFARHLRAIERRDS